MSMPGTAAIAVGVLDALWRLQHGDAQGQRVALRVDVTERCRPIELQRARARDRAVAERGEFAGIDHRLGLLCGFDLWTDDAERAGVE